MKRRAFVAGGATAGMIALAGCLSSDDELREPRIEAPAFDAEWDRIDETYGVVFEDTYGPVTVTAKEHRVMYENATLRQEVREKTLDEVDAQLSLVFATRIGISPAIDRLPFGAGRSRLMAEIDAVGRRQFESQLRNSGLENVSLAEESEWETDSGHAGSLSRYEASMEFDDVEFQIMEETSLTIEGDDVDVSGWLASWHDGSFATIAGGVHPAENFAKEIQESLSSAIDVTLRIDLGLEPETYRQEVHDVLRSIR